GNVRGEEFDIELRHDEDEVVRGISDEDIAFEHADTRPFVVDATDDALTSPKNLDDADDFVEPIEDVDVAVAATDADDQSVVLTAAGPFEAEAEVGVDETADVDLVAVSSEPQPMGLMPLALALVLGLAIGFASGYGVAYRGSLSAPEVANDGDAASVPLTAIS